MIRLTIAVSLFLAAAACGRDRPNVVLILADDLGYGELGCQGNPQIPTPHIDSIAESGVRFTAGYVSSPYCCPSRAGLMTGRHQTRFGHELNVVGEANLDPKIGLPLTETTLAARLKKAGYATGLAGKWHLGGTEKFHPQSRGFGTFFGFLHEGHFYLPVPYRGGVTRLRDREPPYDAANPVLRGRVPVNEPAYLTDAISREAVRFIDGHKEEPFFLYVAYSAVHSPMQATHKYLDRFGSIGGLQRQVFAAMLSAMDDGVGRILGRLKKHDLTEDTLVIFLSDNGGPTKELTSSNKPLRGGKGQLWEGGIRVPFMMKWPGRVPAGKVYREPVIALDVVPTALAAAGVAPPKNLDGVDLLPHLRGEAKRPPHGTLFWRYGKNLAVREGDWKLVRQGTWGKGGEFRLFDLKRDPGEGLDLKSSEPGRAAALMKKLKAWSAAMSPPLWGRLAPTVPLPKAGERVVFAGDSITYAGHYVAHLQEHFRRRGEKGPEIINLGLPSETLSGLSEEGHPFPRPCLHERLGRLLDKAEPDWLYVAYGMNDGVYKPFSEARFRAFRDGVRKVIDAAARKKVRVVFMTPTPFEAATARGRPFRGYDAVLGRYSRWLSETFGDSRRVIDVRAAVKRNLKGRRWAGDGVHPGREGHRLIARAVLEAWYGSAGLPADLPPLPPAARRRHALMRDAWLTHVGHSRPGLKPGLPLAEARKRAAAAGR